MIVPIADRVIDFPIALTGTLRAASVSQDDGTIVEIVK